MLKECTQILILWLWILGAITCVPIIVSMPNTNTEFIYFLFFTDIHKKKKIKINQHIMH